MAIESTEEMCHVKRATKKKWYHVFSIVGSL